jgi:hypothetical protein
LATTAQTYLISHGVSDLWLPLTKQTLRPFFKSSRDEKAFFELQEKFFDTNLPDPSAQDSNIATKGSLHAMLEGGEDVATYHRTLGEGGVGIVDEVSLTLGQDAVICVRKKIGRPTQLQAQHRIITAFAREIGIMRQVDHRHCVRFLGSYTDLENVNILSTPVADMDLAAVLEQPIGNDRWKILYKGIDCLCNAL